MIGVISYLPKEPKLRNKRLTVCNDTIQFLLDTFPEESITVIAQCYDESEFFNNDRVIYDKYDIGLGVGGARNKILEKFYASTDKWLYMCDDDCTFYNHYDITGTIRDIYYGKYDDKGLNIVLSLDPSFSPFREVNIDQDIENYITFTRSPVMHNVVLMLYRNNDSGLMFDTAKNMFDESWIPEDAKFVMEAMAAGMKVNELKSWVLRCKNVNDSSIFDDVKLSNAENQKIHADFITRFKDYVQSLYNMDVRKFVSTYSKAEIFRVKRNIPYHLKDTDIPVKRGKAKEESKMKVLF